MAARKIRESKGARLRRDRYGRRPTGTRPPLPVIVVVCDDARTAVAYFNALKRLVKERLTLTVRRNPHDRASATEVVRCAAAEIAALKRDNDRADRHCVWALIDREGTPDRQTAADQAKAQGDQAGVKVALSNPCYEVWTLLHLVDTGETFIDCRAVIARVERAWQERFGVAFGSKAQADYTKIIHDRAVAAERAQKHCERGDPSWTEVYRVLKNIDDLAGQSMGHSAD